MVVGEGESTGRFSGSSCPVSSSVNVTISNPGTSPVVSNCSVSILIGSVTVSLFVSVSVDVLRHVHVFWIQGIQSSSSEFIDHCIFLIPRI